MNSHPTTREQKRKKEEKKKKEKNYIIKLWRLALDLIFPIT